MPALTSPSYDVALSFAGEQRDYVERVAELLVERGVEVFYDRYETADMWGRELVEHLDDVYRRRARFCVLFASQAYRDKVWTTHERRSAQARALRDDAYVLPVRFDDVEIPGLRETVAYLDARMYTAEQVVEIIATKLSGSPRPLFVPRNPDRLWDALRAEDSETRAAVTAGLNDFVRETALLEPRERDAILMVLRTACPLHLPEYVHVRLDKVRRLLDSDRAALLSLLAGVSSMGFAVRFGRIRTIDGEPEYANPTGSDDDVTDVFLSWTNLTTGAHGGNATALAVEAAGLADDGLCSECGSRALSMLDMSQLSSATARAEAPRTWAARSAGARHEDSAASDDDIPF